MKNLILALLLVLTSLLAEAQYYDFDTHTDVVMMEAQSKQYRQRMIDNHIRTMQLYKYKPGTDANKKGILDSQVNYDENGNMVEYIDYKKNGKIKGHYEYKWNADSRITELCWRNSKGKMTHLQKHYYDANGNNTEIKMFWKSPDNMTWHWVTTYNNKQDVVESKTLKGKDEKLYSRSVCTYYDDGSKKQTVEYNGKGKVKHTWNFECNPVGKLANLKDTGNICIRYETDKDGNRIKIKEEHLKEGATTRIIRKFDVNNNMLEYCSYDKNGTLLYRFLYTYNSNNEMTEYTEFKKKSTEVKTHAVSHYDEKGIMTEYLSYKDNSKLDTWYKYDYKRE